MRKINQQNPPLPKKKRVDDKGNSRYRLAMKSGNATMILCKGLTENACDALIKSIFQNIKNLGGCPEVTFLMIR